MVLLLELEWEVSSSPVSLRLDTERISSVSELSLFAPRVDIFRREVGLEWANWRLCRKAVLYKLETMTVIE